VTRALAYPQPAYLQERLSLLQESVTIARQIGDPAALLDAYVFLLDSLLATGDIAAVDREMATMQTLVEDVGEPFYDYCLVTKQAMRCLLDGQFAEAEALAQRGMGCSQQMVVDNAEGVFGMQMFSIRRLQGRLRTLAPVIAHFVATHSDAASWRPGLALVYAEIGDRDNAQREFAALSADGFAAVPRDSLFQTCLSYLADVCFFLGEAAHAPVLFRLLEPYAEQAIVSAIPSPATARLRAAWRSWPPYRATGYVRNSCSGTRWSSTKNCRRGRGWRIPASSSPRCCCAADRPPTGRRHWPCWRAPKKSVRR
jgi:hypothetical protein